MRLVKFMVHDIVYPGIDLPVFIAPGAVTAIRPNYDVKYNSEDLDKPPVVKDDGTLIWLSGHANGWAVHVKEDIKFVMNALYYSNDGGHTFGSTNEGKKS